MAAFTPSLTADLLEKPVYGTFEGAWYTIAVVVGSELVWCSVSVTWSNPQAPSMTAVQPTVAPATTQPSDWIRGRKLNLSRRGISRRSAEPYRYPSNE